MTIDYGFATTDEVKLDVMGLPIGEYHVHAIEEEQGENFSETNPAPVIVEWKVLDGEHKGKTGKVWYNVNHTNPITSNIARQTIKRIAEATGRAVTAQSPIKGRVLKVKVEAQKNDETRSEVKKYMPADDDFLNAPVAQPEAITKEAEIPFN
jgi:ribosomal protein L24